MKLCNWHSCDNVLSGRQTKYCSIVCKNKQGVTNKRRDIKIKLVQHHGNKCMDCGYKGPAFMYDFDHRDPKVKLFALSTRGYTLSYSRMLEESLKCDLVCPTCHRMRTHKQRCLGCNDCNPR